MLIPAASLQGCVDVLEPRRLVADPIVGAFPPRRDARFFFTAHSRALPLRCKKIVFLGCLERDRAWRLRSCSLFIFFEPTRNVSLSPLRHFFSPTTVQDFINLRLDRTSRWNVYKSSLIRSQFSLFLNFSLPPPPLFFSHHSACSRFYKFEIRSNDEMCINRI